MALFARALRTNAHVLNFTLVTGAVLAPVMYYAFSRGPSGEEVAATLEAEHGADAHVARTQTGKITHFWAHKRSAAELDAVYSQLLRQGRSSMARHHELSGALAAEEARASPAYSRTQALLAQPPVAPPPPAAPPPQPAAPPPPAAGAGAAT